MKYHILTKDRREAVAKIEGLTGTRPTYTGVPRYAYVLRGIVLEPDNTVTLDADADMDLVRMLLAEGIIAGEEEAPLTAYECGRAEHTIEVKPETVDERYKSLISNAPAKNAITFPLDEHRAASICNLVFTIYAKGDLISKATGGKFHASQSLVEKLQTGYLARMEDALSIIDDAGEGALTGLSFKDGKVAFIGFPDTKDACAKRAWSALAEAINRAAITMYHVKPLKSDSANEKYTFRAWLVRMGMNGPALKQERILLYRNLNGNNAFSSDVEYEKWKRRLCENYARKRAQLKE